MRSLISVLFLLPALAAAEERAIAVRDLKAGEGVTPGAAATLTEAVASELRRVPGVRVSTQQEILAALTEQQQKQALACDDASCMADFGGTLGVTAVLTGNLGRLGESWLFNLKLIDTKQVKLIAQADRRIRGGTIDDVLDQLPGMVFELFGPSRTVEAPAPPAAPAPAPAAAPPTLAERLPGLGHILNGAHQLCLDVKGYEGAPGDNVMLFECDGGKDQLWRVNGTTLDNALGKAALAIDGKAPKRGANVELAKKGAKNTGAWTLIDIGNGWFELHELTTGLCLDVKGYDGKSRDNVMLWECERKPDQLWFWDRVQ